MSKNRPRFAWWFKNLGRVSAKDPESLWVRASREATLCRMSTRQGRSQTRGSCLKGALGRPLHWVLNSPQFELLPTRKSKGVGVFSHVFFNTLYS